LAALDRVTAEKNDRRREKRPAQKGQSTAFFLLERNTGD
jgi:hypothetical protein